MKTCKKCNLSKTLDNFTISPSTKDKLRNWCRDCFSKYDKERLSTKPREYHQGRSLIRYWPGSTHEEALQKFNELKILQNGLCAICGNSESAVMKKSSKIRTLTVDHNHETQKVRELLCANCNSGIGHFKEQIKYLKAAIAYLEKHNENISNNA